MAVGDEQRKQIAATLIGVGVAKKDVAKAVGVTPTTISNWCREEQFQEVCAKAAENVIAGVLEAGQSATSLALAKIIELIGTGDKRVALSASQDILDRFGLPKGLRQDVRMEPVEIKLTHDFSDEDRIALLNFFLDSPEEEGSGQASGGPGDA